MFSFHRCLDEYTAQLNRTVQLVDRCLAIQRERQRSKDALSSIALVEDGIRRDDVILQTLTVDLRTEAEVETQALVLRSDDDLRPISHLRIFDTTNDAEMSYSFIQPQDLTTNKKEYCEAELDGYEFIHDAEHDPDALVEQGYQRIVGLAKVYDSNNSVKGVFHKTSHCGDFYECLASCLVHTWYCDGHAIWLSEVGEQYQLRTTFDYDYNVYAKVTDEEPDKSATCRNLHKKIAELQKELATLKKERQRPNG